MKQTAVEWLEFRYKNNISLNQYDFEQAKEMEKEQIIDAYNQGCIDTLKEGIKRGEQYYNETFNK